MSNVDERQGADCGANIGRLSAHDQMASSCPEILLNVAKGDGPVEREGNHRAGDFANFVATCDERVPRRGWCRAVKQESAEALVDVTAGADALDHFLAEITTFGEAH